jgi:CheY-like chemotaxis protein
LKDLKVQPSDPSTWDVLLVDDEADNLTVLEVLLEFNGVRVTTARSGQEAIDICRRRTFTLVLMDIQMPLVSGWDVIKEIRGNDNPEVRSMLVVAVTAHAMHGDRERVMMAGFDGYISKPVNVSILMANLQMAVQRHCAQAEANAATKVQQVAALEVTTLEPKLLLAEQKPSVNAVSGVNGHGAAEPQKTPEPAPEAIPEPPPTQDAVPVDPSMIEDKPKPATQEQATSQALPVTVEPKVAEEASSAVPPAASGQDAHIDNQQLHVAEGKDQ